MAARSLCRTSSGGLVASSQSSSRKRTCSSGQAAAQAAMAAPGLPLRWRPRMNGSGQPRTVGLKTSKSYLLAIRFRQQWTSCGNSSPSRGSKKATKRRRARRRSPPVRYDSSVALSVRAPSPCSRQRQRPPSGLRPPAAIMRLYSSVSRGCHASSPLDAKALRAVDLRAKRLSRRSNSAKSSRPCQALPGAAAATGLQSSTPSAPAAGPKWRVRSANAGTKAESTRSSGASWASHRRSRTKSAKNAPGAQSHGGGSRPASTSSSSRRARSRMASRRPLAAAYSSGGILWPASQHRCASSVNALQTRSSPNSQRQAAAVASL
mmetsp:Transcript_108611/g.289094  ORF Transcript_108611/g.289094 Transcript_108611/m.289094 type:complete len:321 (-) Transcript_108611:95-1057(-)